MTATYEFQAPPIATFEIDDLPGWSATLVLAFDDNGAVVVHSVKVFPTGESTPLGGISSSGLRKLKIPHLLLKAFDQADAYGMMSEVAL